MKNEKWVYVVSKFDTLDNRVARLGTFDEEQDALDFWWNTVTKNVDLVRQGYNFHVESLRVA